MSQPRKLEAASTTEAAQNQAQKRRASAGREQYSGNSAKRSDEDSNDPNGESNVKHRGAAIIEKEEGKIKA